MATLRFAPIFVIVLAVAGCGGPTSQSASMQVLPLQSSVRILCRRPCVRAEFAIPTASSGVNDIAAGPDGNLWFSEGGVDQIGKITTGGLITEFPIPRCGTPCIAPSSITAGPDGNLWFAGSNRYIGSIGRLGLVTQFRLRGGGGFCHWYFSTAAGITAGPDGNLWFTDTRTFATCIPPRDMNLRYTYDSLIDRIAPNGTVTEFLIANAWLDPDRIAAGPDHNLWFTERGGNRIGRITTGGVITEFPLLMQSAGPDHIAAGPDGNVWFTETTANKIGRITPQGVITEFAIPTASSSPIGIAKGRDRSIWFAESNANQIGRITTGGAITEYPIPTASSSPYGIAAGPDGNIWFTENAANKIGKLVL